MEYYIPKSLHHNCWHIPNLAPCDDTRFNLLLHPARMILTWIVFHISEYNIAIFFWQEWSIMLKITCSASIFYLKWPPQLPPLLIYSLQFCDSADNMFHLIPQKQLLCYMVSNNCWWFDVLLFATVVDDFYQCYYIICSVYVWCYQHVML